MYDLLCNVLTSADNLLSQLLELPPDLLGESSSLGPSTNNLDHRAVNAYSMSQNEQTMLSRGIPKTNRPKVDSTSSDASGELLWVGNNIYVTTRFTAFDPLRSRSTGFEAG